MRCWTRSFAALGIALVSAYSSPATAAECTLELRLVNCSAGTFDLNCKPSVLARNVGRIAGAEVRSEIFPEPGFNTNGLRGVFFILGAGGNELQLHALMQCPI